LAQRDPAAKLELERGATRRCLAAVTAIEDEGVRDVVAVRNGEEARPEVVVLALAERRVVPQALAIEDCTIDDHRRMKEGGREQRRPPDGAGAARHPVHRSECSVAVK